MRSTLIAGRFLVPPHFIGIWCPEGRNIRLTCFDPDQLKAFDLAEVAGWFKPSSDRIYSATAPMADVEVPLTLSPGTHKIEVPAELATVDELIVPTSYKAMSNDDPAFALFVFYPQAGLVEVLPQKWFTSAQYRVGQQWITRAARDPESHRIVGECFGVGTFLLEEDGCRAGGVAGAERIESGFGVRLSANGLKISSMPWSGFRVEERVGVRILRLQSDDGTNRLTRECVQSLSRQWASWHRMQVPLVVAGNDRFFSAGADLKEISQLSGPDALAFARMGQAMMEAIDHFPAPVYAAIDGYCMGGGLDLALACDHRIASPHAIFGHRGAALGLITGWGGTQRLPRLIGKGRALEMFVAAEKITAPEALRIGLVDAIADDPVAEAVRRVQRQPYNFSESASVLACIARLSPRGIP